MTSIKFRALTHNDHKLFFEALGEYGKDFQNIQQYMAPKCGKSNNKTTDQSKSNDPQEKKDDDKKREQIRNFYNKLYGKLSQLVGKLDDRVERGHQELYLLINYGEIWKKHGFKFNNKTRKLLEELIHYGTTTLRLKGKNVRLKTPICKALKKINKIGVDEKVKVLTMRELPKDIYVEFHPSTNKDWLKVQSMSQNPRVRAKLSIQKRLCNILEFLENKWNLSQDKMNRTVDTWLKVTTDQTQNPLTSTDIHPRLRLKPSARHELNEVNITRVVPDNHLDLSLNAYIGRLDETMAKNIEPTGTDLSQGAVVSLTTPDCSILLEGSCTSDQPSIAQARRHLNFLQSIARSFEGCENSRTACEDTQDRSLLGPPQSDNIQTVESSSKVVSFAGIESNKDLIKTLSDDDNIPAIFDEDAAVGTTQSSRSEDFNIPKNLTLGDWFKSQGGDDDANDAFPVNPTLGEVSDENVSNHEEIGSDCQKKKVDNFSGNMIEIKKLADGWTRQDESTMTVGELYLAFNCPEKIVLEYEFENIIYSETDSPLIFRLLTAASLSLTHIERQKQEQPGTKLKRRKGPSNPNTLKYLKRSDDISSNPVAPIKTIGGQHHESDNLSNNPLNHHQSHLQAVDNNNYLCTNTDKSQASGQVMTLIDIEATNQRVEEALKQLQPTRLSVYRRAR